MNTLSTDLFTIHFVVILCNFVRSSSGDQARTIAVEQYRAWSPISDNNNSDDENVTISTDTHVNLSEKPTLLESVTNTLHAKPKPTSGRHNESVTNTLHAKPKPTSGRHNGELEATQHISKTDGFSMKRKIKFSLEKKKKTLKKKSLRKKSKYINFDKINVAHGDKELKKKSKFKIIRKGNISSIRTQEVVTVKDINTKKDETKTTEKLLVHNGRKRNNSPNFNTGDDKFDLYYLSPLHISNQLRFISENFSEEDITIEQEMLGKTHQNKDIIMLKVTEKVPQSNMRFHVEENIYGYTSKALPEKKIIFIVHGLSVMNIRSVPCLAVSEFFVDLISIYFDHLGEFDIFLIPMANPDGVAQKKSYWNKNKSPQKTCPGVALDRNFDISWNTRRNMSSCSQQYPGPDPFSEPETQAVRSVFQCYGHRIAAFLNLHAGSSSAKILKGNAILYPKGYEFQALDQQYGHLKAEVLEALHLYTGGVRDPHIVVDTMNQWHGKVAGTSVDYAALVYRTPVSLELVMRPYKQNKAPLMDEAFTDIWTPALEAIFDFIERTSKHKN